MKPLTQEQTQQLHAAIDAAEGPKQCRYVAGALSEPWDGDTPLRQGPARPGCVIAQLAFAEGVSLDIMHSWGGCVIECLDDPIAWQHQPTPGVPEQLQQYPMDLLSRLQAIWDGRASSHSRSHGEQALRDRMRAVVNEWPKVELASV